MSPKPEAARTNRWSHRRVHPPRHHRSGSRGGPSAVRGPPRPRRARGQPSQLVPRPTRHVPAADVLPRRTKRAIGASERPSGSTVWWNPLSSALEMRLRRRPARS
jgi:hypothetical protein